MDSNCQNNDQKILKKPEWIRQRIGQGGAYKDLESLLRVGKLHTVCEEALCPNRGQCWQHGRATVMILGGKCSRSCRFCNVEHANKSGIFDADEPQRVAAAVKEMRLREIVITSVTRDDLKDGGSSIWAETIQRIHEASPEIIIEVLIPDFGGDGKALAKVLESKPDIVGHNIETVPSLYSGVRPQADYDRSLELLSKVHKAGFVSKTGIMLGLGEEKKEVLDVMKDARKIDVDIFYLGQYLQPSKKHLAVKRYVEPSEFEEFGRQGMKMGFKVVVSAPLVRSSFHSEEQDKFIRKLLGRN